MQSPLPHGPNPLRDKLHRLAKQVFQLGHDIFFAWQDFVLRRPAVLGIYSHTINQGRLSFFSFSSGLSLARLTGFSLDLAEPPVGKSRTWPTEDFTMY